MAEDMKQLIFVTSNDNKAREAAQMLGCDVRRVKLDLDELQSMDLRVIIEHKARQAYAKLKNSAKGEQAVIVDDVSFEVDQWGGFPGPFAVWLDQTISYAKLPGFLTKKNRRARWITMLGFFDGKIFKTFTGIEEGRVALQAKGTDGYGFDPIFIRTGETKTVAELGFAVKQKKAARILALKKLKKFLKTRR